jgi:peroxiredoxin
MQKNTVCCLHKSTFAAVACSLPKQSQMAVQVGQPAPDFSLFNTQRNKVKLSELQGAPVLLLFFPMAFSSVCTAELCSTRDNLQFYNNANAAVFGISVDSPYALTRFKEDQQLNFELLSDFNKEVSAAYGGLHDTFSYEMRGVGKRAAFVIDRDGIVRYAEVLENPGQQPDFAKIQDVLTSINR